MGAADPAGRLEALVAEVERACPRPLDAWETTAVVESLGWTDDAIADELGFPDALALGRHVHDVLAERSASAPRDDVEAPATPAEPGRLGTHARLFTRSVIYALPWIGGFVAERLAPGALDMPASLAAPMALAVLGSLVTVGGFIQLIARRGFFHVGAGLPHLARRATRTFSRMGLAASILVAFAAVLFGFYQDLFADERILMAAAYFLVLCALWLACAELGIWDAWWPLPLTFAAGGFAFGCVHWAGLPAMTSHVAAAGTALVAAHVVSLRLAPPATEDVALLELPRTSVLFQLLAPFFIQGILYFAFLFADRIVAGSAVPSVSGLPFAVDGRHARAADLGLMAFFVAAATAECASHALLSLWRRRASVLPVAAGATLAAELGARRASHLVLVGGVHVVASAASLVAFGIAPGDLGLALACMAGYLLLALAALDAMLLMSLGRPAEVAECFGAGLAVNVAIGYPLAHWMEPSWAAAGLVAGSAVLLVTLERRLRRVMANPGRALHAAW